MGVLVGVGVGVGVLGGVGVLAGAETVRVEVLLHVSGIPPTVTCALMSVDPTA